MFRIATCLRKYSIDLDMLPIKLSLKKVCTQGKKETVFWIKEASGVILTVNVCFGWAPVKSVGKNGNSKQLIPAPFLVIPYTLLHNLQQKISFLYKLVLNIQCSLHVAYSFSMLTHYLYKEQTKIPPSYSLCMNSALSHNHRRVPWYPHDIYFYLITFTEEYVKTVFRKEMQNIRTVVHLSSKNIIPLLNIL